jgi:magnesium-transporting ATPase (P-type)
MPTESRPQEPSSATTTPVWHATDAESVVARLESSGENGLSPDEVRIRLERHGPNALPEAAHESSIVRFLKQFHNTLIYVLIGAAVITGLLEEWVDTGVIVAVVLVNAVIGFIQEGKAEAALEGIRKLLSLDAMVVRGGRKREVKAEELVPGDVVLLEGGDQVPADLRILVARNALVDEAALTGESVPVRKSPDVLPEETPLGDRANLAFSGTLVTSGTLRGVVVATGTGTEIGRIGELVEGVQKLTTPLLQKIDRFGKGLSVAIVGVSALLFLLAWQVRGYELQHAFLVVVSFAVAAIPEGLPAILTITLALGVQRMASRRAIIRHLPAVETLGSVTTICSDKTGTLTRNEMMVDRILAAADDFVVEGAGYSPEGTVKRGEQPVTTDGEPLLERLARASLLCNDAEIEPAEDGEWRVTGDPTEAALLVLASRLGLDRDQELRANPRRDTIPFDPQQRYMATLHSTDSGGGTVYLKGAPERLLEMCQMEMRANGVQPIDGNAWHARIDELATSGHRTLALAVLDLPEAGDSLSPHDLEAGPVLLGVVGMIDPPRPEAIVSVEKCRRAGIRVRMITGDHVRTASSIGAEMGIGDGTRAITGNDVEAADDEELITLVRDHDVFARASPEHKLRLVRALQADGEVAAMTGDGVNDAPALKQADIGVAMGIKGTEAAKSASEMVLADDNFATIERAVEEGRTVYDNLKKTILFILPTNGAEALLVICAVVFAFAELPITPVQILWVNMVTAVTLALALAFEPAEPGIMARPPRPPSEPILSRYLLWRVAFVSTIISIACLALFLWALRQGASAEHARSILVNALVAGQLFYMLNTRYIHRSSLGVRRLLANRAALIAIGALVLLQLVFTYTPWFQRWFGAAPLRGLDWLLVVAVGVAVFSLVELEKAIMRRRAK